ncbi:hypothetical protein PROFUN_05978 [Planoprotostelium fungivorum]|uniref:Uncharacterized protein n=1 Tax=Planoprotostelium fungivorum TaxID=1890364 RepID=A0A2P6NPB0_9EUKA|nr:hypothetical protein PROFUN_05978 [Planoprotostelium fungivorum]
MSIFGPRNLSYFALPALYISGIGINIYAARLAQPNPAIPQAAWSDPKTPEKAKRAKATAENTFQAFPLLSTAIILGNYARLSNDFMNGFAAVFLTGRAIYAYLYLSTSSAEPEKAKYRSLAWISTITASMTVIVSAANRLSGFFPNPVLTVGHHYLNPASMSHSSSYISPYRGRISSTETSQRSRNANQPPSSVAPPTRTSVTHETVEDRFRASYSPLSASGLDGSQIGLESSGYKPSYGQNESYASLDGSYRDGNKDMMISDLRRQVAELLRYRDQSQNMRAQLTIYEEKEKIREQEYAARMDELNGRTMRLDSTASNYRNKIIELEEDKMELIRRQKVEFAELHSEIKSLRADAERRERTIQKLEYELTIAAQNTHSLQSASTEKESAQVAFIKQLQERINELSLSRQEYESNEQRAEKVIDQLKRELRERNEQVLSLQRERDMSEKTKFELNASCSRLQNDFDMMESKMKNLESEQEILNSLRGKAAQVNTLQRELRQMEQLHCEMEERIELERQTKRFMEEERAKALEDLDRLEKDIMRFQNETETVVRENERLKRDASVRHEKSQNEWRDMQREMHTLRQQHEEYRDLLVRELKSIEPLLRTSDLSQTEDSSPETVKLALQSLKKKLNDGREENDRLRQSSSVHEEEIQNYRTHLVKVTRQLSDLITHADTIYGTPKRQMDGMRGAGTAELQGNLQTKVDVVAEAFRRVLDMEITSRKQMEDVKKLLDNEMASHKETRSTSEQRGEQVEHLTNDLHLMESDMKRARDDVEQLFYAVQLLMRGLRPIRVKNAELIAQKKFLMEQLELIEHLQKRVHDEIFDMSPDHRVKKGRITIRVAGIAILARNRLVRISKSGGYKGRTTIVEGDRVSLASPKLVRHIEVMPSLPASDDPQIEAENFVTLMNHFDPVRQLEDDLFTSDLLSTMERRGDAKVQTTSQGEDMKTFRQLSEHIGQRVNQLEKEKNNLKSNNDEMTKEMKRLKSHIVDLEATIDRLKSNKQMMENQIKSIENEKTMMVHRDVFDQLKKNLIKEENDRIRLELELNDANAHLSSAKEKMREMENQIKEDAKKAQSDVMETEEHIKNLRETLQRRSNEVQELQSLKNKSYEELLSTQTELRLIESERKTWKSKSEELEEELDTIKRKLMTAESKSRQEDREREDLNANVAKLRHDLTIKEKELQRIESALTSLTEAHQKTNERSKSLSIQLDQQRDHSSALRRELDATIEREANDRRERMEWYRSKTEKLRQDTNDEESSFWKVASSNLSHRSPSQRSPASQRSRFSDSPFFPTDTRNSNFDDFLSSPKK